MVASECVMALAVLVALAAWALVVAGRLLADKDQLVMQALRAVCTLRS